MKNLSKILGTVALMTTPLSIDKAYSCDQVVYHSHAPITRGCEAGPHYIPGRPVGNVLKFIFCPRCHRQHAEGTICICANHVHATPSVQARVIVPVQTYQTQTTTSTTTTTTTTVTTPTRQIYYSLP